jgi:hypothetical protein
MRRRLWPLELSAVMTFGVLAILTLSQGLAWKERARLLGENDQLRRQIPLPLQVAHSSEVGLSSKR